MQKLNLGRPNSPTRIKVLDIVEMHLDYRTTMPGYSTKKPP
jgi:hypothetical protein